MILIKLSQHNMKKISSKLVEISFDSDDSDCQEIEMKENKVLDRYESCKMQKGLFTNPQDLVEYLEQPIKTTAATALTTTLYQTTKTIQQDNKNTNNSPQNFKHKIRQRNNIFQINLSSGDEEQEKQQIKHLDQQAVNNDLYSQSSQSYYEENIQIDCKPKKQQGQKRKQKYLDSDLMKDKKNFSMENLEEGEFVQLVMNRKNSGINYFLPQFDIVFTVDSKHLLSCKKQFGANFQYILYSSQMNLTESNDQCYMGRIYANFSNTVFNIEINKNMEEKEIIGTCILSQAQTSYLIPMSYDVYLLKEGYLYQELVGNQKKQKNLFELYEGNKDKILYLRGKKPEFCEKRNVFLLDFKGKVKKGSVKNFILENPQTDEEVLYFGKAQDNFYNIQINSCMSPFLAISAILPKFATRTLIK